MKTKWFKLAALQIDMKWEDRDANLRLLPAWFQKLTEKDLILLPETFSTGFTMKSLEFCEKPGGTSESFLLEMASRSGAMVGGGWIEANPNGLPLNTFSLATPMGEIKRYRKMHPFSYAGENAHFSPGENLLRVEWRGVCISPLICYDLRFPEIFRASVGKTDLYAVIGNWPSTRIHHWLALLKARAIENQAYVIGVNRVGIAGKQKKLFHNGYSGFFSPSGSDTILTEEKEGVLEVSFSMDELKRVREEFPYLKDIRGTDFSFE